MDLNGKKFGIYGVQGSGKTVYAKEVTKAFRSPLVFSPHRYEWKDSKVFFWETEDTLFNDFDYVCGLAKAKAKEGAMDLFVIDEADMFVSKFIDRETNFNDIILNHRHYGLAIAMLSRRPQDIPTKFVESTHVNYFFKLEGDNVIKKLKAIDGRIAPLVEQLKYKDYRCVVKEIGEAPYIQKAIKL